MQFLQYRNIMQYSTVILNVPIKHRNPTFWFLKESLFLQGCINLFFKCSKKYQYCKILRFVINVFSVISVT